MEAVTDVIFLLTKKKKIPKSVDFWRSYGVQNFGCEFGYRLRLRALRGGEYTRGVGCTCQSDSAFCQITSVLVVLCSDNVVVVNRYCNCLVCS